MNPFSEISKNFAINHNVSFNVYDAITNKLKRHYEGHNSVTHSMLLGIGHYLIGDGTLNQGWDMLHMWVPKYISLGTMGLKSQACDEDGLPTDIGSAGTSSFVEGCTDYMKKFPGFGADGYDVNANNDREWFGLGPQFADRPDLTKSVDCELISSRFPRAPISYRTIIPEVSSELPRTIDVVFSAMISTGALKQFREYTTVSGQRIQNDYIFVTEAGLWSSAEYKTREDLETGQQIPSGSGLLAGYRIAPPNRDNWDMTIAENRNLLQQSILRVGYNEVVQVVWKIQLGSVEDFIIENSEV